MSIQIKDELTLSKPMIAAEDLAKILRSAETKFKGSSKALNYIKKSLEYLPIYQADIWTETTFNDDSSVVAAVSKVHIQEA